MRGILNAMIPLIAILVIIIAFLLLINLGAIQFPAGSFFGGATYNYNYNQVPAQPQQEYYGYDVYISIVPDRVCVGDTVTGYITSNIPNGVCGIFVNPGSAWQFLMGANLDATGSFSQSTVITQVMTVYARAVCCDEQGNCRASNQIYFVSEACPPPSDGDDQGDDGGLPESDCTDTDGGQSNQIYIKGTCTDFGGSVTDSCVESIVGNLYVNENWCENHACMGASVKCPSGLCINGACMP